MRTGGRTKKILAVAGMILALFFLSACQNESQALLPFQSENQGILFFNTPETVGGGPGYGWQCLVYMTGFASPLTDTQRSAVFPKFDTPFSAEAFYHQDGSLLGVVASIPAPDGTHSSSVEIGVNTTIPPDFMDFPDGFLPRATDVYGVPVTAAIFGPAREDSIQPTRFRAEFTLDGLEYRVLLYDYRHAGTERMTEIVTQLISGGTEGLATLADPEIPEFRSEEMCLDTARLDPDFGKYVPSNIPDRFTHVLAYRSITQNTNSLYIRAALGADSRFQIRWHILKTSDAAFAYIDSLSEQERHEGASFPWTVPPEIPSEDAAYLWAPIFFADELALDILHYNMEFHVLFDNYRVRVHTEGISPEEILDMFAELVE